MNRKDVVSIRLCLCREIPKNVENVEKKCEKSVDVKWMKQIFAKIWVTIRLLQSL